MHSLFSQVFISENRSVSPKFTKSESKLKLQLLGEGKLCSVSFEGGVCCAKSSVIRRQFVNEGEKNQPPNHPYCNYVKLL